MTVQSILNMTTFSTFSVLYMDCPARCEQMPHGNDRCSESMLFSGNVTDLKSSICLAYQKEDWEVIWLQNKSTLMGRKYQRALLCSKEKT